MAGLTPSGGTPKIVVQQAPDFLAKRERYERKQILIELFSALYDKAATYTTLILAGGYAGFFAAWTGAREYLSRFETLASAFLISFSLLVFMLWQIYVMFNISRQHLAMAEVLEAKGVNFDKAMESQARAEALERARLAKIWPPIFWITTVPGILGALILLVAFVRNLIAGEPSEPIWL